MVVRLRGTLVPRPDKTSKCRKCKGAKVVREPSRVARAAAPARARPTTHAARSGRRRIVVVTRVSSVRPDELSVDVLGSRSDRPSLSFGQACSRGDNDKWLARWTLATNLARQARRCGRLRSVPPLRD